jgi:hypothetical protein
VSKQRRQRYGLTRDSLILHCPGPLRSPLYPNGREWEQACERFFADESVRGTCAGLDDLTIITYNNSSASCLLERCLAHLGVANLVVLGRGQQGWGWDLKISLVLDYLRSGACSSDYVLCLDGYDVLMLADPRLILEWFLASGAHVLFCGTASDWPPSPACRRFEEAVAAPADLTHCHLNAGGYVARRAYLEPCLAEITRAIVDQRPWCLTRRGFSDQLAWRHLHARYYPSIRIDTSCRIFARFDRHR